MKFFYALLAFLLPLSIFAQSNYRPGYVVQNNGDTLKGYINYREWVQCPQTIEFKRNPDDRDVSKFTPHDAKGFQVTGLDTYLTYDGLVTMNRTNFDDLPNKLDSVRKPAAIFLKEIATGKFLTLYYQNDDTKIRYFIAEKNGKPAELRYYRFYTGGEISNVETYKGQLKLRVNKYYPGNTRLEHKVELTSYELDQLRSLINEINQNTVTGVGKSSYRFFAGVAFNSTKVSINGASYIDSKQSLTYSSPKINFGIDIFANRDVQKLIFRTELSYSYIKPRFVFDADPQYNVKTNSHIQYGFDQNTVSVTPQLLINLYNTANLKIYIDGGLGLNFSSYANQRLQVKNTDIFGNISNNSKENPYKLSSFWFTAPVQAGAIFGNIEVHFTFLAGPNYTPNSNGQSPLEAGNQAINVGVKYLF